jgi:hypothetical protein
MKHHLTRRSTSRDTSGRPIATSRALRDESAYQAVAWRCIFNETRPRVGGQLLEGRLAVDEGADDHDLRQRPERADVRSGRTPVLA